MYPARIDEAERVGQRKTLLRFERFISVAPLERARSALAESFRFAAALIKDVRKLLTLALLNIIPIVNWIVTGYFVRVVRRNPGEPLEVRDFGELFKEGFKFFLAVLLLAIVLAIPFWLVALALMSLRVNVPELLRAANESLSGRLLLTATVEFAINLLLGPAIGLYMRRGKISEIFAFGDAWRAVLRFGVADYAFACLVVMALTCPVTALSSILSPPPPLTQGRVGGLAEALLIAMGSIWRAYAPSWLVSAPLMVLVNAIYYKVLAQLPYPAAAPPPPPPPTPPPTIEEMYEELVNRVLRTWGGTPERAKARIESSIRKVMEERGVSRDEAVRMLYEEL